MAGGLIKPKKQLQRDQSLDPIRHISQPASTILRRIEGGGVGLGARWRCWVQGMRW